jgi:hypothetical protein
LKNVLHPFLGQLWETKVLEELVKGGTGEKILFEMLENARACLHDDWIIVAQEVSQLLMIRLTRARVHMLKEIDLDRERRKGGDILV